MRGAMSYGKDDVKFEKRPAPVMCKPTDAVARVAATCVCGSDLNLWPYRGISPFHEPSLVGTLEPINQAIHPSGVGIM